MRQNVGEMMCGRPVSPTAEASGFRLVFRGLQGQMKRMGIPFWGRNQLMPAEYGGVP